MKVLSIIGFNVLMFASFSLVCMNEAVEISQRESENSTAASSSLSSSSGDISQGNAQQWLSPVMLRNGKIALFFVLRPILMAACGYLVCYLCIDETSTLKNLGFALPVSGVVIAATWKAIQLLDELEMADYAKDDRFEQLTRNLFK